MVKIPGKASFDRFDDIAAPSTKKGNQADSNKELTYVKPEEFEEVVKKRESTAPENITFIYCIVFPAVPKKAGAVGRIKKNFVTVKEKTQEEVDDERHQILKAIRDAGFVTELVYSTTKKQILCKIGCNDARLLKEAELKEYKLELDPQSVQHVLELKVNDIDPDARVSKPKHPVFLGYADYDKEYFDTIQHIGGEEALPLFLYDGFDPNDPTPHEISLHTAKETFRKQSRFPPFQHLHIKYDSDWERRIVEEHYVQLYRTYNDGTILRTADRITMIQSALVREDVSVNGTKGANLNLKKLKFKGQVLAYYPIQFSRQTRKAKDLTSDQLYAKFLSKVRCLPFKVFLPWRQPIQDMRDYCGEKIAYYFAFLEFYSYWLTFSAFFGLVLFLWQLFFLNAQTDTYNIVQDPVAIRNFSLEEQPFFTESNIEISNISKEDIENFVRDLPFASERTPFAVSLNGDEVLVIETPTELPFSIAAYALLISLWAAFFLEFWKRHQATLAYKWGVSDYERTAEVRPEFKSDFDVPDAVTGLPTPYRSPFVFGVKISVSLSLMASAVLVTLSAFAATYIFKAFMSQREFLDPTIATQIALIINAGAIIILGMVFKTAAKKLTEWENHRTDVEFEDQLIGKTFVFSFFNSYTTLIYFAFIKSGSSLIGQNQYCVADLQGFELNENNPEGRFNVTELNLVDTCYGSLGYSLIIIFASQILVNNSLEVGIPLISKFMNDYFNVRTIRDRAANLREQGMNQVREVGRIVTPDGYHNTGEEKAEEPDFYEKSKGRPIKSPAESQYLLSPYESPFQDYLELALQFGYVTLFVAAFPLAPTLALVNNCIEVWVDANKVCRLSRRPNVVRAQDIGTWLQIFSILSYIAIVTNSGVLIFTSVEIVPVDIDKPENKVWAFLGFILGIFAVKYFTDFFISDVPTSIKVQIARQNFIEKKIFYDDEDDQDKVFVAVEEKVGIEGQTEADYREFKIRERDPYMDSIIVEVKNKLRSHTTRVFEMIDTNNNDFISLSELKKALARDDIGLGEPIDEIAVRLFVEALDLDGDGKITREELHTFLEESDPEPENDKEEV